MDVKSEDSDFVQQFVSDPCDVERPATPESIRGKKENPENVHLTLPYLFITTRPISLYCGLDQRWHNYAGLSPFWHLWTMLGCWPIQNVYFVGTTACLENQLKAIKEEMKTEIHIVQDLMKSKLGQQQQALGMSSPQSASSKDGNYWQKEKINLYVCVCVYIAYNDSN